MRFSLALLCSALLLATSGCETTPSARDVGPVTIDYGAYPDNYEQIIKAHFAETPYEPSRFGKPFAGYLKAGPLMGGKALESGYVVEVWLRVKDGSNRPERRLGTILKNGEVLLELSAKEFDGIIRAPSDPTTPPK